VNKPRSSYKQKPQPASDAQRLRRIEMRKARSRAVSMSIMVLLIMLITAVLIINVMSQTKPRPRFIFIQEGTVEHILSSTGLIVRNETVIESAASGILKPLATEGSRVARGQKTAMVIPAEQEKKIKELAKLEQDIVELQIELMNSGKGSGARAIYDESNAAMSSVINLIRADLTRSDISNVSGYSTSLDVLIDQRTTKLLPIDFKDARIDQLKNSKTQLELSLGLETGTIYSQSPGILSFELDGLENELTMDAVPEITPERFSELILLAEDSVKTKTEVEAGDPVLRITGSLTQQLIFWLEGEDSAQFEPDTYQDLSVPSDGIVIPDCRIIRSQDYDNGALVTFETSRRVEWFSDRRTLDAEIVLSSTSGLRVPLVSLVDYKEKKTEASIMIVSEGLTQLRSVRILDHDDQYAIIEPIDDSENAPVVSTILVVNPDSVEEGQIIAD
jgi:biotin carboxyl carrier protein